MPSLSRDVVQYEWVLQTALRCGSIAGSELPLRVREGLLNLSDVCLLDLYAFLRGWSGQTEALSRVIRTFREHRASEEAYWRFFQSLLRSRRNGRVVSNKVSWILPNEYLNHSMNKIVELSGVDGMANRDVGTWLPWTSLSVVNCLRRWRAPLISALRRAIFKLANDFDPHGKARYPWEPGFRRETRYIPIEAIYQYEPSTLTLGGIRALLALGFTSVNDLRFLHQDAIRAAKRTDEPLLKIYRRFMTM